MSKSNSSLSGLRETFDSFKNFIRIDFDIAWKASMIISVLLIPVALISPPVATWAIILLQVWLFIQKTEHMDDRAASSRLMLATSINFLALIAITIISGKASFSTELLLFSLFYAIIAVSLNMSFGVAGLLNFGVVAQVLVGAVTVGLLTVNGMPIFFATIIGMLAAGIFSGLLAMTSIRLRDDYFAIVSLVIGEIFKQFLKTEPTLRGRPSSEKLTTPGILDIPQPFKDEIENFILNAGITELSYRFFLGIIGMGLFLAVFFVSNLILYSPYGRVLKGIREDQEVTSTYGKDIFRYKVMVMVVSGAIAGLGGAFMAWIFVVLTPEHFEPIITFFAWTAFIVGGKGNNKGMALGAIVLVGLDRVSRLLSDEGAIDSITIFVQKINYAAPPVALGYIQLIVVGTALILFLRFATRGLLPEETYRPKIRGELLPPPGSQSEDQKAIGNNKEEAS